MTYRSLSLAVALIGAAALPSQAQMLGGDAKRGRQLAMRCVACHGLDGAPVLPDAPHLAGQPQPYLVKALNAYRSGARHDERMSVMAQQMNDQDVLDLSAWFSSIQIEIRTPE